MTTPENKQSMKVLLAVDGSQHALAADDPDHRATFVARHNGRGLLVFAAGVAWSQEPPKTLSVVCRPPGHPCARAAAKADGVMFSDCVDLRMEGAVCVARRPVYSGKAYVELARSGERTNFITIRPNNIPPASPTGGGTPIESHDA